jgi:dihydrofolate synthase/folylpolyglutamate synthase
LIDFAALLDLEKTPAALPYDARAYDLEGFRDWLAELGNPERGQSFVHIAGTKGKGSTAALVESMLLALGYSTATFTSPHLAHFGERYRYDGAPWSLGEFEAALNRLNAASQPPWRDALKSPHRFRTAFEFMTMVALREFSERGQRLESQPSPRRQVVCWETGLGGRLDCTNVVDPLVSVITTLGLEHTAILGDTIEQIATEKAGIIKPGRPVVVARQTPEFAARALAVIRRRAEELNAPLWLAWETSPVVSGQQTLAGQTVEFVTPGGLRQLAHLPLHGPFQQGNLEAALTAVWLVASGEQNECKVSTDDTTTQSNQFDRATFSAALTRGIAACCWPGRFELHRSPSGQMIVLDGAHCPLSAAAAAEALQTWRREGVLPPGQPVEILWGMQRDKKHQEFLTSLVRPETRATFGAVHTYPVRGVRGADAETLAEVARGFGLAVQSHPSPQAALKAAADSGCPVLAVGTLYTLAELREHWRELQALAPSHEQPSR